MDIRIKMMGVLKDQTPEGGRLTLSDGDTITEVLNQLKIPLDSVQVFTVNGTLERDKSRTLAHDDELTILPPVGGG